MTFLTIVMRELRVTARRRGTYWVRLLVALAASIIGAVILFLYQGTPPELVGGYIFKSLTALSILYCLISGRLTTADCISQEKREGTLGLLFLTDLKGYDVVFGKLVATSLNSFYGLLAVFPVLAIPLLLGGVTHSEFWRIALVLVTTFLFSIAIAMFCSSINTDARRAVAANFGLALWLMAALPAVAGIIHFFTVSQAMVHPLFYSCPVYACCLGFDALYKLSPDHFWWSITVIQGLTWLLLLLACRIVPRSWQDKPLRSRAEQRGWRELWYAWSYGQAKERTTFRKQLLDANAFYWLAGRARLKPVHVWTFLGLLAVWWLVGWLKSGSAWLDEVGNITTALILNTTIKLWITLEAGQRLAEDQKAGAFELLLPTPLTARDILDGQLMALRRQFLAPLIAVIVVELLLMRASILSSSEGSASVLTIWMAGLVMLIADVIALTWVAMRLALTAKTPSHAAISTVTRVLILPWVAFGMVVGIAIFWHFWTSLGSFPLWSPGWKFNVGWWFALGMLADLVFGCVARHQLLTNLRGLATHRFEHRAARFSRRTKARVAASAQPTNSHSGELAQPINAPRQRLSRRKRTVSFVSVLVLIIVALCFRSSSTKFAPPVIVSLSHSNAPLRVFPGPRGVFLVLPNGSLWHWGQAGGPRSGRSEVPEQVGTNCNWVKAAGSFYRCVGLQQDGTLWEWVKRESGTINTFADAPVQLDRGKDWVEVSAGGGHSAGLKKDGTLWAWGDNTMGKLGNGLGPHQANPVQVGTNQDWAAVCCAWTCTLALRKDGTLWAWGQVYSFGNGQATVNQVPFPTKVCLETNWLGFETGFRSLPRNRLGELWEIYAPPDPDSAVGSTCRLILSNSEHGRIAFAVGGSQPKLYEVRANGTLWERTPPFGPLDKTPAEVWRRVGKRSDWVSICGAWGAGTVVGLTADGTIWTWGIDPSREPALDFSSRLTLLQERVKSFFGNSGARVGTRITNPRPPYQKQPRPLMRLVPGQSQPSNTGQ